MIDKNKNKALVRSAVLLGITPFLNSTNYVCSAGGGPGFSSNKDNLKLNFKIAKLVSIKAEDVKPGDVLMTGVDGFLLEKGKNGDYGYRSYDETLEEVRNRLPKDEYESIKAKFDTDEEEEKEIYELSRRRKIIWIPAEKIMKLVQIENVTKEVLEDIENNIKSGNKDKIYVTEDGKYKLKYDDDTIGRKRFYYDWPSWSDKEVYRDKNGIYTVRYNTLKFIIGKYGGPPVPYFMMMKK